MNANLTRMRPARLLLGVVLCVSGGIVSQVLSIEQGRPFHLPISEGDDGR